MICGSNQNAQNKKVARRINSNFKSSVADMVQKIWISSVSEDERNLVTHVLQLIDSGIATNDKVHLTILMNLVKKLRSKRMFHYSDMIIKLGKMARNRLGRTSYALFSVS